MGQILMLLLIGVLSQHTANGAPIDKSCAKYVTQHAKFMRSGLLQAIATVESSNNPQAINRRSWDYGLMQINHRTAAAYGHLPFEMLRAPASACVATKLLTAYERRFGHERMWVCRYNLGTAASVANWGTCKAYFDKLRAAGYVGIGGK